MRTVPGDLRISILDSPSEVDARRRAVGRLRGASLAGAALHGATDLTAVADADLVLVGLRTEGFDRCGGLLDVERLADASPRPRIAVVIDRPVGPVASLRAVEAGADHLVHVTRLSDPRALQVMNGPSLAPSVRESMLAVLSELGLHARSRPGAGVRYVVERRLEAAFVAPATLEASGLSRRRSITVRTHLSRIVGIEVTDPGSGAVLPRQLPSWRQVHAVITAARGGSPAR